MTKTPGAESAAQPSIGQELLRLEAQRKLLIQMLRLAVSQRESSVRLSLLYASVLKVWRMGGAIELLAKEVFVEEILGLSRTMAEVTINAAYLQDAEDEEIDRFQHFDTQSMFKHSVRLLPYVTTRLTDEDRTKIETLVRNARSITGRKDTDLSWSKRNLSQRAEYSDDITKSKLMFTLLLTAYAYGHSAVHGTFDSLDHFLSAFNNPEALSSDERREPLFLALSSVNFVFYTMCSYLNGVLYLGLEAAIIGVGKLPSDN